MRGAWTTVASGATPCLSWDSPRGVPLLRCHSTASTPGDVAATVGLLVATSRLVPPPWFRTTSTVSSALEFPGLLHPGTGRGSQRFSLPCTAPVDPKVLGPVRSGLSRLRLHTPRRSPPSSSRTTSLWPLPPRRWTSAPPPLPVLRGDPRPRGLAPLSGPLRPPPLPASAALSFHGLRSPPGC